MKVTLKDLNNLQELLLLLSKQSFPIKLSYKILKLIKSIQFDTEFYFKELTEIINKYAVKDDEGNVVIENSSFLPREDAREECLNELADLNALIVEIPDLENQLFTLDEIEKFCLSPSDLSKYEKFIKE